MNPEPHRPPHMSLGKSPVAANASRLPGIWLLRTDDIISGSPSADALAKLLSGEERARQRSYRSEDAQHQFLLGRALMRRVLGKLSGTQPEALRFSRLPSGKPLLENAPELHFSLSHSGRWIALAVSESQAIGIDIEQPQKPRNFARIARHYFHPQECALLDAPPRELMPIHFYRMWTLKEAFYKARGTGISEGLGRVDFSGFHLGEGVQFASDLPGRELPWQFFYAMYPLRDTSQLHLAVAGVDPAIADLSAKAIRRGMA
ncbi:4'-phosphopantetheinyl transferase family protein [Microbulbifer sp. SA54]|uniref:4'-phosphopantetheinyl transferase family protein n=1 Tax=Microbulbifer sp. SA54 TaxID=3401577 RepID=UPI003AAC677C